MSEARPIGLGKVIVIVIGIFVGLSAFGYVAGWFGETAQVVKEEVGPRALLAKYNWFKDVLAQLDAKRTNIGAMQARVKALEDAYIIDGKPSPRTAWTRTDAEQHRQWLSEVAGLKANYNDLAAQYNAAMAKALFAFTNIGDLPAGAKEPLPREVREYID